MNQTPLKRKVITDISANTVQTVVTQVFGLVIFYITSKYLPKDVYGEFNWSMALGSTIIAIASFGLDLVFVKRISAGENRLLISGLHLFHTLAAGVLLSLLLVLLHFFVPAFNARHPVFFLVFVSLAIANISNSLKLYMNGLELYKQMAMVALCTNMVKFLMILYLYVSLHFTITRIIYSYMGASILEFALAYYFIGKVTSTRLRPLLQPAEYKAFILQSLPQLGVVIFDSALARIDWIILGIVATAAATAEYSFAYKVFELSKLPVLIIAPVLLTRFSKLFANNSTVHPTHKTEIDLFLKLELFVVMLIPIALVTVWSPLVDWVTDDKYGRVNEKNYWILALCVPLHALINFLWTLGFVQGQLKAILYITITVSVLNIAANLVFIPLYGPLGASVAFLICTLVQLVLYFKFIRQDQIHLNVKSVLLTILYALLAAVITRLFVPWIIVAPVIALAIYTSLMFITGQISLRQISQLTQRKT